MHVLVWVCSICHKWEVWRGFGTPPITFQNTHQSWLWFMWPSYILVLMFNVLDKKAMKEIPAQNWEIKEYEYCLSFGNHFLFCLYWFLLTQKFFIIYLDHVLSKCGCIMTKYLYILGYSRFSLSDCFQFICHTFMLLLWSFILFKVPIYLWCLLKCPFFKLKVYMNY